MALTAFSPEILAQFRTSFFQIWISKVLPAFSLDIVAHICPKLLLDSSSFQQRCIEIKVFKCGLVVRVGETRRIRTYFREGVPAWFLFPLLCIVAVYDIACQRQMVG